MLRLFEKPTSASSSYLLLVVFLLAGGSSLSLHAQNVSHVPLFTVDVGGDLAGLGDVNGDGTPDFAVGGRSDTVSAFSGVDGSVLFTFSSNDPNDRNFGDSISNVGDVSGDGVNDLAAASDDFVRVVSGVDGSQLYSVNTPEFLFNFNRVVAGVGDVNSDGTPDLAVTSFGNVDVLSGVDGSQIYGVFGGTENDFGSNVSPVGDLDNDGIPDLIVGASIANFDLGGNPFASVLSGADGGFITNIFGPDGSFFGASLTEVGDIDGDAVADLLIGSRDSVNGRATLFSGASGNLIIDEFDIENSVRNFSGKPEVSGLGDINGDGTPDFALGAPFFGDDDSGVVSVISGIDRSIQQILRGDILLDEQFGNNISGLGDINGDGLDDFVIGGNGFSTVFVSSVPEPSSGTVLVIATVALLCRRSRKRFAA